MKMNILLSYKLESDALLTYFQYSLHPSITPPAVLPTIVFSFVEIDVSWLMHSYIDSQKLYAYSASHATTVLVLSQNDLKSNTKILFSKKSPGGAHPRLP